ncbi:MAG TPA: hypothetical protein VML75_09635 [Kofleriaceae bacterium]|nr:hypothetical protein [Kofleriaceae bacterium]
MLERFRRTGIRLDREGRFWHEGAEITHGGFRRALLRWLDRLPDGRPILRLDEQRYAYVDVDDACLLVTSLRWSGDRGIATFNDGTESEIDYASLGVGEADALYCAARGGVLDARLTTPAYYALVDRLEETAGGYALRARGRLFPIGQRQHQSEPRAPQR